MARVNVVAHGLADEVRGDRIVFQAVAVEQLAFRLAVSGVCLVDFKMVAPTGEFEPVVTEGFRLGAHFFDAEVGPLAGEKSYWSSHFEWLVLVGCWEIGKFDPWGGLEPGI